MGVCLQVLVACHSTKHPAGLDDGFLFYKPVIFSAYCRTAPSIHFIPPSSRLSGMESLQSYARNSAHCPRIMVCHAMVILSIHLSRRNTGHPGLYRGFGLSECWTIPFWVPSEKTKLMMRWKRLHCWQIRRLISIFLYDLRSRSPPVLVPGYTGKSGSIEQ